MVGEIDANASTPLSTQLQLAKEAHFALLPGEPFPDERQESSATQARTIPTANPVITATAGGAEGDRGGNILDALQGTNPRGEGHDHIIGPVVGGSIVIVAISGLLFWFRRRIVYKASTGDDAASKECFSDPSVQHEHLPGPHPYTAGDPIMSPISELGAPAIIAELGDDPLATGATGTSSFITTENKSGSRGCRTQALRSIDITLFIWRNGKWFSTEI